MFQIQTKIREMSREDVILAISLILLFCSTFYFLKPAIAGDGISYLEAMQVLDTGVIPSGFIPNRILTTFGGLLVPVLFAKIFGHIAFFWFTMNTVFFFLGGIVFYRLLALLTGHRQSALLGALFLMSSYAVIRFGLNFLMDMGGFALYAFSLFYMLKYALSQDRKYLLYASLATGIGGLFKEYALLSVIPIIVFLVYEHHKNIIELIRKSFLPAIFSSVPILIVYMCVFFVFDYAYTDWLATNQILYSYSSRVVEYVKTFGALLNFLGILFVSGLYVLSQEWSTIEKRVRAFLVAVCFSCLPVFFWPAITERILYCTVPFVIIVASYAIKKYQKYQFVFIVLLSLYIVCNFLLDAVILPAINLPL